MDIMLDIETLGTTPGCVVLSIGAVPFDAERGDVYTGSSFYMVLDVQAQLNAGCIVSADTLRWWMTQDAKAKRVFQNAGTHTGIALDNFRDWYMAHKGTAIWGYGASFDVPILAALMDRYAVPQPWHYWDHMCVRTLFKLAGRKLGAFGSVNGVAHDALSDALFQAHETVACIKWLKGLISNGKQFNTAELARARAEPSRDGAGVAPAIPPTETRDVPADGTYNVNSGQASGTNGAEAGQAVGAGPQGTRGLSGEDGPFAESNVDRGYAAL